MNALNQWTRGVIAVVLVVPAVAARGSGEPMDIAGESAQSDPPLPEDGEQRFNFLGLKAAPIDEPLVGDRPDFTESTLSVPYGRVQIESGYTYAYDSADGVRSQNHTYPEMLVRIGLVEDFELRLFWEGWSHSREAFREANDAGRTVNVTERDDGGTDMSVGFKVHLWDQRQWIPDFGVIVEASLPTGASGQTSGDVDPSVKWLWAYDLTDDFSIAGNVNFGVPTSDRGRYFETAASLSLAYSITDRLGTYVEYFGIYPGDRNQADTHFANGGFTYLIHNNLQLDIRSGMGLSGESEDFFTGAGFVVRF